MINDFMEKQSRKNKKLSMITEERKKRYKNKRLQHYIFWRIFD